MRTVEVDVAIIGGGTAGMTSRRAALNNGAERVVMIEGDTYGTTCARVGCMPSKLLIAAAESAHRMREANVFGVRSEGGPQIDGAAVMDRVQRERDRFVGFVRDAVEDYPEPERLKGYAKFLAPTSLQVDDHTRVEAKSVVIATGSSPWTPPPFRDLGDRLLTTDQIFELPTLPQSLAIIGTGVIGIEIGQAMHRLGVRTAFFNPAERVGGFLDPHMQSLARNTFADELDLRLGTEVVSATRTDGGVTIVWKDHAGQEHQETFERVLSAAGRRSNLGRLDLDKAGLVLDERGIPVHDERTMQCGTSPVFLAGDVHGHNSLLHEAADDGHIAGHNAATFPEIRAHMRRIPLAIVFSDPQMAVVGTPGEHGEPVVMGEVDYGDQGRARVMHENRGCVRIWAKEKCGHITGAEMFGPRVEHTAHLLAWAIGADLTVHQALAMPFYHPVIEEGIRTALRRLAANLKIKGPPHPLDFGPGT